VQKKKLVLKTEFGGKETYGLFRDAALHKHQRNKRVVALLKKKKSRVVTRLEFKNVVGEGDLNVIVEIFEDLGD